MIQDTSKISKKALKKKLKAQKDTNRLQCNYILPNKGKQCNMTRRKDEEFCAQHILLVKDSIGGRKRISCPLDKGHSVWQDQLKLHLEKCRAKPVVITDEWYKLDMNIVSKSLDSEDSSDIDFTKWIPVLSELYNKEVKDHKVIRDIRENVGLDERLSELENKKHATQQSSLIGHMADNNLLYDDDNIDRLIIEFGCGRSELSRYIYRSQLLNKLKHVNENNTTFLAKDKFLFVDRSNPRMKLDGKLVEDYNKFTKNEEGKEDVNNIIPIPQFHRLKIDIKDLNLDKSPFIIDASKESPLKVTAVSKHLCGCATDLTLTCLKNSNIMKPNNYASLQGIVIALCCRQLCSYETYPAYGMNWLKENGITKEGFKAITRLTSWAVCGTRERENESEAKERERIGLMARRVIDLGRVKSLRELGYQAEVVEYVDKSFSLENHCLVVTGITDVSTSIRL